MKIRDTITRLLAKKPQTLVIVPILFALAIIVTVLAIFSINHKPTPIQPPANTNTLRTQEPAMATPKTVQGIGGVSLPEDPQ